MIESLVMRAADFAAGKHRHQRRKDERESPYINHPIRVAALLAEVGGIDDPEVLAAALLHDTIEDTDTSAGELARRFGARVASLVEEVSDDRGLSARERKQLQIAHAAGLSRGAALIKLGDKISNVRDMIESPPKGWSRQRRLDYLSWAAAVIERCPKVSPALERLFWETFDEAQRALGAVSAQHPERPRQADQSYNK